MDERSDFAFRGERDYVHGTAILKWLLGFDPDPRGLSVMFHKLTDRQCRAAGSVEPGNAAGLVVTYKSLGGAWYVYETGVTVTRRGPCNEAEILSRSRLADGEGEFTVPMDGATFFEAVVAVYKGVVQRPGLNPGRKLLFARMNLSEVPDAGVVAVRHRRTSGGFFEANLFRDESRLGTLVFGTK